MKDIRSLNELDEVNLNPTYSLIVEYFDIIYLHKLIMNLMSIY